MFNGKKDLENVASEILSWKNLAGPLVWAVQLSLTHKYLSVGWSKRLKHTKSRGHI